MKNKIKQEVQIPEEEREVFNDFMENYEEEGFSASELGIALDRMKRIGEEQTLKKVEEVIDEQIFQMNDLYRIIKNKTKLSEHDRGWENCSIYLKELKKELEK